MFSNKIGASVALVILGLVASAGANSYFSLRICDYFDGRGAGPSVNLYKYNIIPEVLNFCPYDNLYVFFNGYFQVAMGNELTPAQIAAAPIEVKLQDDTTQNYAFMILDIDSQQPDNPTQASYLLYFVVNIPGADLYYGTDLSNGTVVVPYMADTPSKGDHRIVFLMFKQALTMENLSISQAPNRKNADPRVIADMYGLGQPLGANFCRVSPAQSGASSAPTTSAPGCC